MIKAKGITMHATNHTLINPREFFNTIVKYFDANQEQVCAEAMPEISLQAFHIGKDIYNRTGQDDGNVPMIVIHTTKDLRCTFNKRQPVKLHLNDIWHPEDLTANISPRFPD